MSDPSKWTKPPTYPFIPNHVKKHPKTQTNSAPLYHSATAIHLFGNQQSQRPKPQPASPATLAAGERYLGPNRNTRKWEMSQKEQKMWRRSAHAQQGIEKQLSFLPHNAPAKDMTWLRGLCASPKVHRQDTGVLRRSWLLRARIPPAAWLLDEG